MGLPLTILKIREEHEVAVVEMGISDFGEMHRLAKIARPDVCVMTNIGLCHLENLKSRDGILKAKSEIFDFLKPDGVIVLNGNDDKLSTIEEVRGVIPMRYFVEDGTAPRYNGAYEVTASDIENRGLEGMTAVFHFPEGEQDVVIPIPGVHNVYNALAGACVGRALGLTTGEILDGIAAARTIDGRTNLIHANGMTVIDDCYNANPVSMRASLDVLEKCEGRRVAGLGIDVLFCAGELSKEMARAAEAGCEVHYFPTREELLPELLSYVKEGDTILVKASHFMEYPKIVKALT